MRILWAVSSVGKNHIIRDIAVFSQLKKLADIEVDWLVPDPAREFMRNRNYHVLECSAQLAGSGKIYEQVFAGCTREFNLMNYVKADTKLHKNDFMVSAQAWKNNNYDVIVGDEAFWLLTGFSSKWERKPAPFVFITDFIGTKAMKSSIGDKFTAWYNNLKFSMSHFGPDVYIFIGAAEEIPNDRLGFLLPNRRKWAQHHCRFVKNIVNFDSNTLLDKQTLRQKLNLPEHALLFLATIVPEGDSAQRVAVIEDIFQILRADFPDAHFMIVCSKNGSSEWIQYYRFLDNLYQYFAASDFVIIQSGIGKISELSALGIPFIAIPLDYHFEQEYVMRNRLEYFGVGKLMTFRGNTPQSIATTVQKLMGRQFQKIAVDNGSEIAHIILETVKSISK